MSRIVTLLVFLSVIALALVGCRRDAQPDPLPEAEAEPEAAAEAPPAVPTCGGWVVVVESPTVTGRFDANLIQRNFIDGLRAGGCEAFTSRPAQLQAGAAVLQIAPRVQAVGDGANLAAIATDVNSGQVHSRHQEQVPSGDGAAQARTLGQRIAEQLTR